MDFVTIVQNVVKIMAKYWDVFLIKGLSVTLSLSAITVLFGALLGSLLALIAGIIGFTKRVKFSGVLSLIAVVASAGAAAAAVVAGSELSVVAGSAFSSVALVAGGILAVVALVHAIVALAPSKAAAV